MNALADPPQPVVARILNVSTAGVWPQLVTLIQAIRTSPDRWTLLSFPVIATLVIAAIAAGQVRLNAWQGALYDSLQRYDLSEFLQQVMVFIAIVAVLLVLVVTQTWITEVSKVKLRA